MVVSKRTMKETRKGRTIIELCVFTICISVVLMSISQYIYANSPRKLPDSVAGDAPIVRHERHADEPPKAEAEKKAIQVTVKPQTSKVDPKKANAMTQIQLRIRAKEKAQMEIRELERMLSKLMRENNQTPQQSVAKFATERYNRKIGRIIRDASEHGVLPHNVNGSRLRKPQVLSSENATKISSSNNSKSAAQAVQSDKTLSSSDSVNLYQTAENTSTLNAGIVRKRKSRTLNVHWFKQFNKTEEEEMKALLTGQPPSEDEYFKEILQLFEDIKTSAAEGTELFVDEEALVAESGMAVCTKIPDSLVGSIGSQMNLSVSLSIEEVMKNNSDVMEGGEWKPVDCIARHRVAIVIPYRDRWAHLKVLLYYIVPMLKRQQIHFRIFVVEQYGNDTFNKGLIMNAAFREAIKLFDFQCVTFHDVDLVPEDDRNMYSCSEQPKHMSIAIDKFAYFLPYEGLVGGVLSFQTKHFQQVNGYSNMYWGWGAEDDDMTIRIMHRGLRIYRPPSTVARYKMVKHQGRTKSEVSIRMKLLRSAARRSKLEGLNNVNYKLMFTHLEKLFTHFMVDVGKMDFQPNGKH